MNNLIEYLEKATQGATMTADDCAETLREARKIGHTVSWALLERIAQDAQQTATRLSRVLAAIKAEQSRG